MSVFTFNTTPSILSGPGAVAGLAERAASLLGERVLVVTDAGLVRAGIAGSVAAALAGAGAVVEVFDDVSPEPPETDAMAAAARAKAHGATGILGLGGGSPMDVSPRPRLCWQARAARLPRPMEWAMPGGRACRWCWYRPPLGPGRRSRPSRS